MAFLKRSDGHLSGSGRGASALHRPMEANHGVADEGRFRERRAEGHPVMSEQSRETTEPASAESAPTSQTPRGSDVVSPERQKATRRRRMLLGAAGAVVLAIVLVVGIPWIVEAFNTVSTDDAYVNGHVTFVAARVRGQVARVQVDDNNRVRRGDLLVVLDKEPYQTAVAIKRAAVDTAKADLQMATATVRGIEAEARSRRWKLQHAMEDVANRTSPGFGAPQLLVARRRSFRPRLWEWSFKPSLARQAARWVGVEPVGIELFAEPDVKDSRHDCVAAVLPMAMRLMRARH